MVKKKGSSKKLTAAEKTHCTSYGIASRLKLDDFFLPPGLYEALRNSLKKHEKSGKMCKDYIECLKSLKNLKEIEQKDYFVLFKICLYLEDYEKYKIAQNRKITNHKIKNINRDNCFCVKVPALKDDENFIDIDDRVKIKHASSGKSYSGTVVDIEDVHVTVHLSKKQKEEVSTWQFLLKISVDITFIPSNFPIKCCHYALNMMYKHNLHHVLFPEIETCAYSLAKGDLDWVHESVAKNPEQRQAVYNILNKTAYPAPYLLFGPPGTGKTTTLVEAVCQIWKKSSADYVLICASSNTAVDEITKKLLKVIPAKDIYRMYTRSCKRVPPEIEPCSNIIEEQVVFIPKEIFLLKRIVVATLVTCTRLAALKLRADHFSYIFIDEAGQAIEPEALIPLTLSIKNKQQNEKPICAQMIIAGDPYQLGPVVKCDLIQHLLGQSFIERLMKCKPYQKVNGKYNERYATKLIRNYRSRSAILHIPNRLFYEGELLACVEPDMSNNVLEWPELLNKTFPIIFSCTTGTEIRNEYKSVYNIEEVFVAVHYVKKLLRTKIGDRKIQQKDIGIVTPFRQQRYEIENKLKIEGITNVSVGTVEIFQGQEKQVIIFSTVRSRSYTRDGKQHVGFLSNPKRFNVGITRARMLLIIVGNPNILREAKCWKSLFNYCERHDACITVDSKVIKKE